MRHSSKLFVLLFLSMIAVYLFPGTINAQELINLQSQQIKLSEVFSSMSDQSGYRFSYNPQIIDTDKVISVNIRNKTLDESLSIVLPPNIYYKLMNNYIILLPVEEDIIEHEEELTGLIIPDSISREKIEPSPNPGIIVDNQFGYSGKKQVEIFQQLPKTSQSYHVNDSSANVQIYDIRNFHSLDISYNIDNIRVYESESDDLVLIEYLKEYTEENLAWIRQTNGTLQIKSGKRLWWFGNSSQIDIYLPKNYRGNLKISNVSGQVISEMDLELNKLEISNVGGLIDIQSVIANEIVLKTTAGKIKANDLEGEISINSVAGKVSLGNLYGEIKEIVNMSNAIEITNIQSELITIKNTTGRVNINHAEGKLVINTFSGPVDVAEVKGSASIVSTAGLIAINFTAVTDSIFLKSMSGKVSLFIPEDLPFNLMATSTRGSILTHFGNEQTTNKKIFNLKRGDIPRFNIDITTTTGNIEVKSF